MYRVAELALFLSALAGSASAHGVMGTILADGKTYEGQANTGAGPVWSYQGPDPFGPVQSGGYSNNNQIACNYDGKVGASQVEVQAGSEIELTWTTGGNGVWAHDKGPIIDYLAAAPSDFTQATTDNLKFFKIAESGLENGDWTMNTILHATNKWKVTVPASLKAGNYVLRHEPIALHQVGGTGPENYPICISLKVSGGGSDQPEGVLGNQLYTLAEKGLTTNPYGITSYEFPGPKLASLNGGGTQNPQVPPVTPPASSVAAPAVPVAPSPTPTRPAVAQPPAAVPSQPGVYTELVVVTVTDYVTVTAELPAPSAVNRGQRRHFPRERRHERYFKHRS
ncbi:lytic polysaccharide monooxygenase [Aaosphaeria arxii CBS 175.79]|uniref:Lytic polysaccharide monooxygenase n=1 Tax=Aaosphaeria arxii CBS 175.79 TaxID=1450172 RepID=A0A6A5XTN6_9PLEO|nr:lytic polysaccharide monooxygenase [Aaosphaeria arxii CBS 175.79]KAF2016552.1 lytic polysaccharide monooxygenase [Aaosphaeria arxii CBS 175.79]